MPLSPLLLEANVDYDAIAHVYDHRYEREEYPGLEEALATFIGDDPAGILEVGCGTGHWLAWLAQRGFSALAGLDPSAAMLAVAATKVRGADLRQGRAEHMPWHDASFDRVVCVNALQHFGDQPRFVAEARRVLQPGGGLITIGLDPHVGTDRWTVYDFFDGTLETDLRRYPPTGRIRGWLSAAGFAGARTFVAMHRPVQMPARAALAAGYLDRTATSQLTLLSDDVYEDGIARITRRADQAERRGETFAVLSDLRLYATVAWIPT